MSTKFYKISNGELIPAPSNLTIDDNIVMFPTELQYLSQGWKPLLVAERPAMNKYYTIFPVYEENDDAIIQNWEERIVVTIDRIKSLKMHDLKIYDSSSAVNTFTINGMSMWLGKNDRAALMYSIESEEAIGLTGTSIYTATVPSYKLELPISTAKTFLQNLEVYAKNAYAVTQTHQNNIVGLDVAQDVIDYDFTIGYPDNLVFVI